MKKSLLFVAFITAITLALAIGIFALFFMKAKVNASRPSIIIVVLDALRADHVSCYGYSKKTSPNIDAFAKDAVLFENAVSPSFCSTPSFMSLFTALTPGVHKMRNFDGLVFTRLPENIPTLAMILKKRGYFTAGFYSHINLYEEIGFGRGFDMYERRTSIGEWKGIIADISETVKRSKEENRPLFLFVHLFANHAPYVYLPPEFSGRFLEERVAGLPVYPSDVRPHRSPTFNKGFYSRFNFSNPRHLRHLIGLYDSATYYSDYLFGAIRKVLEEGGVYDNAIIVIMADHGEEFFEHGGLDHLRLFIETLHVPFIIKFPHRKFTGLRISGYVRTMDLMPTLLDFLDIRTRRETITQGVSFMPLLSGRGKYDPVIFSEGVNGNNVHIIKDGFAYSEQDGVIRLFDLKTDPTEKINIADQRPDLLERMRAIWKHISRGDSELVRKLSSYPEFSVHGDGKTLEELKALGYAQ